MQDSENRSRSIEEVWNRLVSDARRARGESEDSDYFLGIFDGHMAALAVLASFLGRMDQYGELCEELDDHTWEV